MIVSEPILNDLPEFSRVDQFFGATYRREPAHMKRRRGRSPIERLAVGAAFGEFFAQNSRFLGARNDRFFAINMLVGANRREQRGQVPIVGRTHVNDVDFRRRDQFLKIVGRPCAADRFLGATRRFRIRRRDGDVFGNVGNVFRRRL